MMVTKEMMQLPDVAPGGEQEKYLREHFKIPYLALNQIKLVEEVLYQLDEQDAIRLQVIPIKQTEEGLLLGMVNPLDVECIQEVELITKQCVQPVWVDSEELRQTLKTCYSGKQAFKATQVIQKNMTDLKVPLESIGKEVKTPIREVVEGLLEQAMRLGASDIHIEALTDATRIRMRIDGHLQDKKHLDYSVHERLTTTLKLMSGMRIAEKRMPQDGTFKYTVGTKSIDIRASCIPTLYGEKMVLRLLDLTQKTTETWKNLGVSTKDEQIFQEILSKSQGMLLVTGPTGSGKTTTLYQALRQSNTIAKNSVTLEDPIEKRIKGVNQIQMNTDTGLTFAMGLRSILRQDPDQIMIGEIRDSETAEIAIRAALTGHLVLSTLHTLDAVSALTRLVDMGVPRYLITETVIGIVAQRLVRRVCPVCGKVYSASEEEQARLDTQQPLMLKKGEGCLQCQFTGYKGRIGIYECLQMTPQIKHLMRTQASHEEIQQCAIKEGMVTMQEHFYEHVRQGKTTLDEWPF